EKASQLLDEALVVHARAQARGRATECLAHANAAIELLSSSSAGSELPSAFVTRAWALLHLGDTNEGERALATARGSIGPSRPMALVECAEIAADYGDPQEAAAMVEEAQA